MYQIFIDSKAYDYLDEWGKNRRWRVINSLVFYDKVKVIYQFENEEYFCYFTKKEWGWKFSLHTERQLTKGKVTYADDKEDVDFNVKYVFSDEMQKLSLMSPQKGLDLERALTVAINGFLIANAFLFYGNIIDKKEYIASGRNKDNGKIIVFRPYKGTLYAVPVGHHRSPEGVFEVRGHFRKYKSGKVVWIDSYLKGTEKEEEQKL